MLASDCLIIWRDAGVSEGDCFKANNALIISDLGFISNARGVVCLDWEMTRRESSKLNDVLDMIINCFEKIPNTTLLYLHLLYNILTLIHTPVSK
jgi:hypothetical protein